MPANDTISSFPTTLNGTSLTDSLGVFSYKTGTAPNNNVVDVTLTLTPTIGSQTTNLNFYGTLDQGFLSFDLAGNPNAVTVNTDYTALLFDGYYFGVYNGASDQGFQLSQGGPGKLTWIPGYVSTANAVPEPSALGLTTVAALGLIAFGLKRKKQHTQQ